MSRYKRNQVEEAISRVFQEGTAKPSSALRIRAKRLLDTDRAMGRKRRSADPEVANYAFYHTGSPGRGVEIWFSEYEAFALMVALRLLSHNWPQSFPVTVLRRLRPQLEREHARILELDHKVTFDQQKTSDNAEPGSLYFDTTDPVLLTIVSGEQGQTAYAICRGMPEVGAFVKKESAQSWTVLELVTPAHALSRELAKVPPRKRGRS